MKKLSRLLQCLTLLGLLAAAAPGMRVHALTSAAAQDVQQPATPNEDKMDAPDTNAETEEYRHSSVVQAIAHKLGLKTETTAQIFEDINSGALLLVIFIGIWKVLPKMFRKRSETLEKELTLARSATEDANRRLAEVEARLSRLGGEIDAIRQQAEKDSVEDEKRMHAALESERERIIASAEQEIGALQSAAQRELKKFAADLAVDHALRKLQLTTDADRALVKEFGKTLSGGGKA
ncbi:MAG TPA: ATP synthase F0 subunit B [Acidobacteriaceae bacterium]|nr:ATP synthase F0 subunit B [Acidobacteriaceae bacterium]